jgi:hypothetical protein
MSRCDVCGNEYDRSFEVKTSDGTTRTFDSIECLVHSIAPQCEHCGCRVLGHGIESGSGIYCCAHCAREAGVEGITDNAARVRHISGQM